MNLTRHTNEESLANGWPRVSIFHFTMQEGAVSEWREWWTASPHNQGSGRTWRPPVTGHRSPLVRVSGINASSSHMRPRNVCRLQVSSTLSHLHGATICMSLTLVRPDSIYQDWVAAMWSKSGGLADGPRCHCTSCIIVAAASYPA